MPERARILVATEELEAAAGAAERALVCRDNDAFEAALADQRRLHHELALLGDAETDAGRLAAVRARVQTVIAFRESQIRKLGAYRDSIEKRLATLSRWNAYARGSRGGVKSSSAAVIDSTR